MQRTPPSNMLGCWESVPKPETPPTWCCAKQVVRAVAGRQRQGSSQPRVRPSGGASAGAFQAPPSLSTRMATTSQRSVGRRAANRCTETAHRKELWAISFEKTGFDLVSRCQSETNRSRFQIPRFTDLHLRLTGRLETPFLVGGGGLENTHLQY